MRGAAVRGSAREAREFNLYRRNALLDHVKASLSQRERTILGLLTEGLSNVSIAARLALSEETARNHISNIFDKIGVWSRAEAIVFARDRHFKPNQT